MTRFNNKYPYTDFHELNADWLLETVKDAEAEAKEASETVATYNDRLTTVEGDLAPIKSAMPGIASSISDLTSGLGRVSSQVTTNAQDIADNASNIDNIEDRLTTYDQNFVNINNTFISDERRIGELEEYRTEAQVKIGNLGYSVAPLFDENAAYSTGDYVMSPTLKLHRARVNIPAGTADIHNLTQFQPTDVNNALHEGTLPLVTSADAGDVLTVDGNGDWVADAPSSGVTYSTTEHVVGKWVDDSDIYEKTFHVGSLPNNTTAQIAHNIANIGRVIEITGTAYNNSGVSIGIPYVNTSVQNQLACYVDGVYLYLNTAGDLSQYDGYVTIKYLKTV